MATFKNPANKNRDLSVLQQGVVAYDHFEFDLSASYASGAATDESLIEIGFIPADCVLIPHLTRIDIPQLDAHGTPTGDYEVGTAADPDALKAAAAAETAVVLFGEDLRQDTGPIGSATDVTPIYIRVSNVIATLGSGVIVFEPAFRARRGVLDD